MPYKKDWLVIAHGEPVPEKMLLDWSQHKSVMVLDGAYQSSLRAIIKPDIVLGDFDLPHEMPHDADIEVVHAPDQNATDLEKGLLHLENLQAETVTIVNATGWRLDHTLYNLRLLKRFQGRFKRLSIMTSLEQLFYIEDSELMLSASQEEPVALLSFPQACVTSHGLRYDMQSLTLSFSERESVSNHIVAQQARLKIEGGALLVVSHGVGVECRLG